MTNLCVHDDIIQQLMLKWARNTRHLLTVQKCVFLADVRPICCECL